MAGLTQKNKPHKAGRKAGLSARDKHKVSKEGQNRSSKPQKSAQAGKQQRLNAAKQQREAKKEAVMKERRALQVPIVVAILPLSQDVDVQQTWNALLSGTAASPTPEASEDAMSDVPAAVQHPLVPTSITWPGPPKAQFTLLPPLQDPEDPLALIALGCAAEVVLLAMPGHKGACAIDDTGRKALAVLRALGLPTCLGLSCGPETGSLQDRAAARKAAAAALEQEVPGDHKLAVLGTEQDAKQLLRQLSVLRPSPPHWRQLRPSLMVEAAHVASSADGKATLALQGYVRNQALSANQILHLPGAGDFQIQGIRAWTPASAHHPAHARKRARPGVDKAGDVNMEAVQADAPVIATPDPDLQHDLIRENVPDPLAGEQTWPTEEEMADAEANQPRKRRLPKGTSEYQAAWILDEDGDAGELEDPLGEAPEDQDEAASEAEGFMDDGASMADPGGLLDGSMAEESEAQSVSPAEMKRRWRAQQEDVEFPDEMDTPMEMPARQRFAKYRGLKSWRTSPWDPKEALPRHYARIFALQNPRRTYNRVIKEAQEASLLSSAVPVCSAVEVHLSGVPEEAAARVVASVQAFAQGLAPPVTATGLLQHETKLSVLHFGLRKSTTFTAPLPNKAPLLLVSGIRQWQANGVLSSDEPNSDKHKMERFLHEGRHSMLSCIAPLAFGNLPLLAFHQDEHGDLQLAASGTLKECNPDRVVLKKVVLSGYPVRVHKGKAVVRWMFHSSDDVRWFRPLQLWTRRGRHGHIQEPVGTHGSMKVQFDAPIQQQDAVCTSLYKRVYPKFPEGGIFAWLPHSLIWSRRTLAGR